MLRAAPAAGSDGLAQLERGTRRQVNDGERQDSPCASQSESRQSAQHSAYWIANHLQDLTAVAGTESTLIFSVVDNRIGTRRYGENRITAQGALEAVV